MRTEWRTVALRALGALFFAVGAIGIVVPLLPTTIFWIAAAACWANSAPALRERLLAHPRFGPALRDWSEHGIMSRRAKVFAIGGMGTSYAASAWALGLATDTALLIGAPIAVTAGWIATRRERRESR